MISFVKFINKVNQQEWTRINHFLTHHFYLNVGRDSFYPNYSGYIAHFRLNLGTKAFSDDYNYAVEKDPWGYTAGLSLLPGDGAIEFYSEDEGIESAYDDGVVADF